MNSDLANLDDVIAGSMSAWRPPPRLSLSEWADEHFYLSRESSADHGRWKTLPYQKGIMDTITDPRVEKISVMKSARIGYTKMFNAAIGYYMDHAPCPILVVQPTVEDAKGYSKEEIAPMIRDCPRLAQIVFEEGEETGPKDTGNTILHKKFPGGILSMAGANSGTGFRRISRKVVAFDEVDAYPPSAGSDGDQIKLGIKRTEYYWDRKIIAGSTPLVEGSSRIAALFKQGDQRRFHVPCPQCGHKDILVFRQGEDHKGHYMQWPEGKPEEAHFVCSLNGCVIEHKDKRTMVEGGEWRASAPFKGHASFHIWAAYSYAPNATWGQIAAEFLSCKDKPEELRTFVNTVLGETWKEQGEAPDWERLYKRRETYQIGTVPEGVVFLTAGIDVQKDRLVYEVVGWAANRESWSIDAGSIPGDTSDEATWARADELLDRRFPTARGLDMPIATLAIDSGYNTQQVYNWGRRHPISRVIATKGSSTDSKLIVGSPTPVDVTLRGQKIARGYRVWPLGSGVAKSELYGWLRKKEPKEGQSFPWGYCHFPEYDEDFFKQLTAEHLVSVVNDRTGFVKQEWHLLPDRNKQNHFLDCRVMARAAAAVLGLDRLRPPPPLPAQVPAPAPAGGPSAPAPPSPPPPPAPPPAKNLKSGGWLGGANRGNWLNRRR